MSQPRPRRASTAKYTPKQPPDPTKDIKSPFQQANTHLAAFAQESRPRGRPPMTPYRRQPYKTPPKETPTKPAAKPSEDVPVVESSASQGGKVGDAMVPSLRSIKSVTSEKVGRIQINISLPSTFAGRGSTDLKDLMPSESVGDVESTSKGDLPLSPDDSMYLTEAGELAVIPTAGSRDGMSSTDAMDISIDSAPSEYFDAPQYRPLATDTESRPSTSENDEKENVIPDIPISPLPSHDIPVPREETGDTMHSPAEISPSPSTVVPRAPPTTPATPKREVRLVTAGSSAADWFTRGFVPGKREVKDEKPVVPVEKVDTSPTPEKTDHLKTDLVNLIASPPNDVEMDPATAVAGTAKMTLDIPIEPLGLGTVDNPSGSGTIVVNASLTFNVYRPYIHRSVNVDSPAPVTTEKPHIPDIEQEITKSIPEDPFQSTIAVEPQEELTPDDRSDGSVVLVKAATSNEDADGVKRRWFREEMRQSPERDGNWTVGEEGDRDLRAEVAVTSMEHSVSSISTDFVYVESGDNRPPVVIPVDINDVIVAEPVTPSPTHAVPAIMNAEVHVESVTVQAVKAKYVIVAGQVQRIENVVKHDSPPLEGDNPQETPSEGSVPMESPRPIVEKPSHPQRKINKGKQETKLRRKPSFEVSSDGWSTEAEMDDTPDIPKPTDDALEVPGLVTQVSVLGPVQIVPDAAVVVDTEAAVVADTVTDLTIPIAPASTEDVVHPVEPVAVVQEEIVQVQEVPETANEVETSIAPEEVETPSAVESPPVTEINEPIPDVATVSDPIPSVSTALDASESTVNTISPTDAEKPVSKSVTKNPVYEIVAGLVVRKVPGERSRPSTPKIQTDVANTSNTSTPLMSPAQSTASHHSMDHVSHPTRGVLRRMRGGFSPDGRPPRPPRPTPPPKEAKAFVECGDMADKSAVGVLVRANAPWPGSPFHRHPHAHSFGSPSAEVVVGPSLKDPTDDSVLEHSQFGYGSTTPINQCSVRSEVFDPYEEETPRNLKSLKDKRRPLLQDLSDGQLKALLDKPPNCFCEKMCARFDGVVPVYVCGAFRQRPQRPSILTNETFGCAFHMHVPFWECLRDTYYWTGQDRVSTFTANALAPHLSACPYLNFTFCVKFSQRNTFNMYLPAEIRATNGCACDLDMRLDFSELLQHWAFSCPHYHQQGVNRKCVRRVPVQDCKYKLMENSPNLHGGGAPLPVNAQTVLLSDDKKAPALRPPTPIVHLPEINDSGPDPVEEEDDIFKVLYRTATLNSAGSKDWLGETATGDQVAEWENQRKEFEKARVQLMDKVTEYYLHLEKMLDNALCQKIRDDEQRKREEQKLRLKANVVTCLGCTEVAAMCVFLPCFHMVMCVKCADKVVMCPSCRTTVEGRQRVYTA